MATYYVDYENVHNGGMKGVDEVGSDDLVYVFYSVAANTMTMDTIKKLLRSTCAVEFIETPNGTLNSLDFQLITLLYANIDRDDYHYIISNDKGYDASISMAKRIDIDSVMRFNTIYGAVKDYEKHLAEYAELDEENKIPDENEQVHTDTDANSDTETLLATVESAIVDAFAEEKDETTSELVQKLLEQESGLTISKEKLVITCEGISKSSTKMELYKFLRHNLGDKDGRLIYGAVCDSWGELVVMAS